MLSYGDEHKAPVVTFSGTKSWKGGYRSKRYNEEENGVPWFGLVHNLQPKVYGSAHIFSG